MKKTITFFPTQAAKMLLATLLLTLTAQTARAAEYEIYTLEELREFMEAVHVEDFAGDVIRLKADIDCEGGRFNTGNPKYPSTFRGTFDGQKHKIYNFVNTPTGDGYEGYGTAMFDFAETGATIQNLTLEGSLPGDKYCGAYAAAFVLAVESPLGLHLENCHFNGSVTNVYHSAALVGFASSGTGIGEVPSVTLINCSANANITTTRNYIAGGLVAKGTGVQAYNCSFKGKVTSLGTVGGLIGVAIYCTLENCFEGGYTYIDENSNNVYSTDDYTVLDNTMTTISAGWYVVNSDVTFNGDLSTNADGEVHIILCDGATLTANNITPIGHSDYLRIYGQSQSTGTANISGRIVASSSLQIYGGTINAAGNIMCPQSSVGIHGGNVTAADINGHEGSLSLTGGTITASSLTVDQGDIELGGATVTAGSYNVTQGNVTILPGITYYDGTGASYTAGNLSAGQVSAIAGKTLRTHDYRGGDIGNENNVTWAVIDTDNNGTYETLTISGTGAMSTNPWYSYKNDITSVVINNGVTDIYMGVFMNTPNLTSVTIPASVSYIGQQVFDGCTNLETVSGCEGVTDVGNDAFSGTKWLTDQPDGVIYIGKVAYLGKNVSGEVNIKAGTVSISSDAFNDCTNLTSITIPNSVTDIGYSAFEGCTNLISIEIPNSVTYIGSSAFKDCTSLTSITIPDDVTKIYEYTFQGCTSLISITIPDDVTNICEYTFQGCTSLTSVTIPSSLERIGQKAFKGTGLTSITIPNSVTEIQSEAFRECSNLETVTVYAPNCSLGNNAFNSCHEDLQIYVFSDYLNNYKTNWNEYETKITAITPDYSGDCGKDDPQDVTWQLVEEDSHYTLYISGTGAMQDADQAHSYKMPWEDKVNKSTITNVIIGDGVTSIGSSAFSGCTGLTSVIIPASVTSIGIGAFSQTNLTTIEIPDGVTTIGEATFNGCQGLTSVIIPASVTSIGDHAFDGCTHLTTIGIPASVTSIGNGAFNGCSILEKVTIYATSVPTLGTDVFTDNKTGRKIYVFSNCVTAYKAAWSTYTNDIEAITPDYSGDCGKTNSDNVKWQLAGDNDHYTLYISGTGAMADYASENNKPWYYYSLNITSVLIEDGVTSIGNNAFKNCVDMMSVTIPNSVTSIGEYAFYRCNIKSVTIPASVESLGNKAFKSCSNLATVYLQRCTTPITTLGTEAFDDCNKLAKIYVLSDLVDTYKAATNWSKYESKIVGAYTVTFGTLPDGVSGVAPSMAAEGETVTVSFSGVPDGKVPVVSVTYGDNNDNVNDIIDNGDGTFSFVMPNGTVTVTASYPIEKIPYIDADGNTEYCTNYTVLDNTMTTIPAGWYVVKNNVTFNGDLSTDVSSLVDNTVNIILCDGATLTANNITPIGHSDFLCIYGQSQSTGTANISGSIVASSSLQIYGGTINVTGYIMCPQSGVGIYGGNVTAADIDGHEGSLSLTGGTITASSLTVDQGDIELGGATVTAGSYNVTQGNVTILTGITYYDGTGASYTAGNLSADQVSAIAGKTLRTYDYRGGTCGKDDPATGDVDESLNVIWALSGTSPNYTLTISGTGAMKDYGAPDDLPWKDYRSLIASVVIEDGVTSIGNMAFEGCNNANLTSVTIPVSVERIGDYAFAYCTYLASVTIPVASLTYYGVSAFDDTADGLKIYVPGSALSTYKAATNWSAYKDNFVGVYTLTYDLAGGTLPAGKSNPESYTAEDKNFLLNNPTKEGYAFVGWNYDYTEGNTTSNHTEVFVEVVPFWEQDLSFTATWVAEDETHKDLAKCRAEVDNPLYRGGTGNYVGYYYDGGNGIKVYDGDKLLTYYHYDSEKDEMVGDYSYSMLVSLDGGDCDDMGEHCRVLLTGYGDYVGGLSADVVIVANSVNGKWGDLKWAYDNGTLTISRKDGVTEDVVMDPMSSTGEGYDSWLGIGSGIFSIVFEEGVKTIAETAFGYVGDGLHHYSNLATISLPSSLTEIGANAFAHCDGLTVDLDDILAKNITLGNNAFYQIGCLVGTLANNADNTEKIALLYQAARANVTLSDRTLYKDGNWNTLCLPFDLTIAGSILDGADVRALDNANLTGGVLTLNFTPATGEGAVTTIEAGKPYIIKWASDENLVNPVFSGVAIKSGLTDFESEDHKVLFKGTYNYNSWDAEDKSILFVGASNNLYWPQSGASLGACRAYFQLTDGASAREFVLNFGEDNGDATRLNDSVKMINDKEADAWYTLDGRKLDSKPTRKGLYIYGGRKVVIK